MQPIQITIRDMPNSQALESHIRKKAEKLSKFYDRINSCRIVLRVPQKHKHQGKIFAVHIDLTVPGKEIVVSRQWDQDVYVAIRDAFHALIRQLENYARKRRGHVKTHETAMVGYVRQIMRDGYGFIQGMDGNEYYFSPTNVSYPNFESLELGDAVQFISDIVSDGLQAHRVTRIKLAEETEEWLYTH